LEASSLVTPLHLELYKNFQKCQPTDENHVLLTSMSKKNKRLEKFHSFVDKDMIGENLKLAIMFSKIGDRDKIIL
jgi:hypothetical protein